MNNMWPTCTELLGRLIFLEDTLQIRIDTSFLFQVIRLLIQNGYLVTLDGITFDVVLIWMLSCGTHFLGCLARLKRKLKFQGC